MDGKETPSYQCFQTINSNTDDHFFKGCLNLTSWETPRRAIAMGYFWSLPNEFVLCFKHWSNILRKWQNVQWKLNAAGHCVQWANKRYILWPVFIPLIDLPLNFSLCSGLQDILLCIIGACSGDDPGIQIHCLLIETVCRDNNIAVLKVRGILELTTLWPAGGGH